MQKLTFEQWKKSVDAIIGSLCGLSADDIDDWCYRDDYDNGLTPKRSAQRAIRNAKENCGM
jgi:hypothetical protein